MAHLSYGPFTLRRNEIRTMDFTSTPVMDSSNRDILYSRVRIDVQAVVNPLMLATNQPTMPGPSGSNIATGPGDRAGLTMRQLVTLMNNPQQVLRYWVGQDLVVESPGRTNADGTTFLPCDPMGGPFVRACRMFQVSGDKTVMLHFSVETAVPISNNLMLSNRWSMHSHVDSGGFTTRTITGEARFRLDYIEEANQAIENNLVPDDYRNLLCVPCSSPMKRMSADFTQNDGGDVISYRIVDRDTLYGLGANSGVEKIEGSISISAGRPFPTQKALLFSLGVAVATGGGGPSASLEKLATLPVSIFNALVPEIRGSISVRVYGMLGAAKDKASLYNLGLWIITDRLAPMAGAYAWAAITATQWIGSEDQPIMEIRGAFIPYGLSLFSMETMLSSDRLGKLMNLNNDITVSAIPPVVAFTSTTPRTTLPASANTRGSNLLALIAQIIKEDATDLPAAPPQPPIAMDVTTAD